MANIDGPKELPPPSEPREPDPLPWIGLGILAIALLSFPWLTNLTIGRIWLGIPLILWYLFGVMAALILLAALQRPEV